MIMLANLTSELIYLIYFISEKKNVAVGGDVWYMCATLSSI